MKEIAYNRAAIRVLKRLPAGDQDRIRSKVRQYADDPASLAANVTALKGRRGKRLRVGDWRVIFDETETAMDVIAIGPRGSVYE